MRILHLYKDFPPVRGGIEHTLEKLAVEERRRGLDVEVLVTNTGRATYHEAYAGVRVTRAARLVTLASTPLSLALWSELRRRQPDLVHLHFPYPLAEMAWLLGSQRPAVMTYHSDIIRQRNLLRLYRPFLHRVLARVRLLMVQDLRYAESSTHLGRYLAKVRVVPHGIDIARFTPTPAVRERAAALRAQLGSPLALFVGRFRYYKGAHFLLEAMKRVPGVVALVGDGPERGRLLRLAREKPLQGRVHFLGTLSQEDLIAAYYACDVLVLPSIFRSEAWGLVLLEAMAAGKPVISTELGTGTSILNLHGETGLVTPPADVPALARALDVLFGDAALRQEMGARGRARVEANFTIAHMADRVLAVYAEALGKETP